MTVCTKWWKTPLEGRTSWEDFSFFLKKSETSAHGVLPSFQYVDAELVNSTESPQGSLGVLFLLGVKVLTLFFFFFVFGMSEAFAKIAYANFIIYIFF